MASIERTPAHAEPLQAIRRALHNGRRVATGVGFGPRFLHPTWQIDKGGPAFRLFRQAACDDASDLAVPGQVHTFGIVKAAQARGDCEVLAARGRCALRVHRSGDVQAGREALAIAVQEPRGPGA